MPLYGKDVGVFPQAIEQNMKLKYTKMRNLLKAVFKKNLLLKQTN